MSQYDNITTAADLVHEVIMHGMSTLTEDIARAQDIIGHSTVEEIAYLAEGGEKDCYGNAKNHRIQSTLFQIVFACWDRDRAVALYNEHVTRYPAQLKEVQEKLRQETREHTETKGKLEHEMRLRGNALDELEAAYDTREGEFAARIDADEKLEAAKLEIIRLKVKLFDLMTAGA